MNGVDRPGHHHAEPKAQRSLCLQLGWLQWSALTKAGESDSDLRASNLQEKFV